jgi:hypothetical protein
VKADKGTLACHLADENGTALCILRAPDQIAGCESELEAVIRCGGGAHREASLRKRIANLRRKVTRVQAQRHVPVASAVGETKCDGCLGVLDRFPQLRNKAATAEYEATRWTDGKQVRRRKVA